MDRSPLPTAVYRLQFSWQFKIRDAIPLIDYWKSLGISHLYASPLMLAVPGSLHGYDVLDYGQTDPDRGSEEDLEALVEALHSHGMGLILDIVPNHMAISHPANKWWMDVLEKGRDSPYADYFDINWEAGGGKVVIPFLAQPLELAIEQGELKLVEEEGRLFFASFEHRFPLNPATAPKGPSLSKGELSDLLNQQHYSLCYWKEANERINYRRFFDIYHLAGLRVEEERVFKDVHRLALSWVKRGWVDGLRIDHIDGLARPTKYLHDLRAAAPDTYLLVEKILVGDERFPEQWPIEGTTGYDYLNLVGGLFVDTENREAFEEIYRNFTEIEETPLQVVAKAKKQVLDQFFPGEVRALAKRLFPIAQKSDFLSTLSEEELANVLCELTAAFPVYRTYIRPGKEPVTPQDRPHLSQAIRDAKALNPAWFAPYLDELGQLLLLDKVVDRGAQEAFVMRYQQLTGPVMAKGVEDTAFYRYYPLASINEVGGELDSFGVTIQHFHQRNLRRLEHRPFTLLTTSTHDTKRSGDVRGRIHALSEIPEEWNAALLRWHGYNREWGVELDPNVEYLLYQTMVGAWPETYEEDLGQRLLDYMEKAGKEAKIQTSWLNPNPQYVDDLRLFISKCLAPSKENRFRPDFTTFMERIIPAGWVNTLSQVVLKMASPGIPEFYQGTELEHLALVDPDNRRAVDYEGRRWALGEVRDRLPADCPPTILKMAIIHQGLLLRRAYPELFWEGRYIPLEVEGSASRHLVAFARELNGKVIIAAAMRYSLQLKEWGDTAVVLAPGLCDKGYRDVFTDLQYGGDRLRASELLQRLPVALLECCV